MRCQTPAVSTTDAYRFSQLLTTLATLTIDDAYDGQDDDQEASPMTSDRMEPIHDVRLADKMPIRQNVGCAAPLDWHAAD